MIQQTDINETVHNKEKKMINKLEKEQPERFFSTNKLVTLEF